MIADIDIYRSAQVLVRHHDEDAPIHAAMRADAMLDKDALDEACQREDLTRHQLCTLIDARRRGSTLTAAVRIFVVGYYRAAATEHGHADAGHGALLRSGSQQARS